MGTTNRERCRPPANEAMAGTAELQFDLAPVSCPKWQASYPSRDFSNKLAL